jgi:hypothetical protein
MCKHTSCIEPLRAEHTQYELETAQLAVGEKHKALTKLPLIDSFLKESARLHPFSTSQCPSIRSMEIVLPHLRISLVGVRRKAVTPYTFLDGTHVPAGNWVCVPLKSIQRDPDHYRDAEMFDGFRFVSSNSGTERPSRSTFTDTDFSFPFWGMGKRAW